MSKAREIAEAERRVMAQEMEGNLQYAKPGSSKFKNRHVKLTLNLCLNIYEHEDPNSIETSVNLKKARVDVIPGGRGEENFVFAVTTIIGREDIGKSKEHVFGCESDAALQAWVNQLRAMQRMEPTMTHVDYESRWWCAIV